jgi:RNA polymerase sigma factor (sigma-70 family)
MVRPAACVFLKRRDCGVIPYRGTVTVILHGIILPAQTVASTEPDRVVTANGDAELMLLGQVANGDHEAFETLYRAFQPRIFGFVKRILGDPQLAEEIADDVMMVVWRDADRFQQRSRVSTWIFGIAWRMAANALRRRRPPHSALPAADVPDALADTAARLEQRDWLMHAFANLSHDHRAVVELTLVHGFSYIEIAEITDCPLNTVKTRMFHARRNLQAALSALATAPTEDSLRGDSDETGA